MTGVEPKGKDKKLPFDNNGGFEQKSSLLAPIPGRDCSNRCWLGSLCCVDNNRRAYHKTRERPIMGEYLYVPALTDFYFTELVPSYYIL